MLTQGLRGSLWVGGSLEIIVCRVGCGGICGREAEQKEKQRKAESLG